MSRIGGEFRSVLGYGGLLSLCGIASLLVVALGPKYGIGPAYQIIMIGLLLLTLPFVFVADRWRKRRERRKQEAAEAEAGEAERRARGGAKDGAALARQDEDLTRGAEEVVQWLRETKLAEGEEGDVVYALPWFVVAGPRASGKTSLVLSSGLNFHMLPSQRLAEHRLVRPTRGCDWRVTGA